MFVLVGQFCCFCFLGLELNCAIFTPSLAKDVVDSSLYSDSGRRFSDAESFRLDERGQPRVGLPWRTALVALFLFGFGLTFLLLGVLHFRDKDTGLMIAFATLGSIAFLPGAYATYNLYHAYRGTPGFHLSQSAYLRYVLFDPFCLHIYIYIRCSGCCKFQAGVVCVR